MDHRTTSLGYLRMILLLSSVALLPVVRSLEILDIGGPSVVVNGSTPQVVLDCDYDITEHDKAGFVVKWYFNRQSIPVYQWIPNNVPQDLGILRGRLNLNYEVSEDQLSKHRALAILNPTTDLTGEYTCAISSFESEAFKRKSLIVYAPAEDLSMTYSKPSEDRVLITCRAGGVYPAPNIAIFRSSSSSNRDIIERAKVDSQHFPEFGYYNISVEFEMSDYELDSETMFECVLTIPGTEYKLKEEILYLPAHLSTVAPTKVVLSDEYYEEYDIYEYMENADNYTFLDEEEEEELMETKIEIEIEKEEKESQPQTAESVSGGVRIISSFSLLLISALHCLRLH